MTIDEIVQPVPVEEGFAEPPEGRPRATLRIRPRELRAEEDGAWRAIVLLALRAATTPA